MKRSPRGRVACAVALLFAAAPFGFALIRFVQTGTDLRMFWMAFASLIGATVAAAVGRAREPRSNTLLGILVLAIATLFAGLTAILLGATAASGIWLVALVFGICWSASYTLFRRSRRAIP